MLAGLVDRFNIRFPSEKDGFDSRIPLPSCAKATEWLVLVKDVAGDES